MKWQNSPGTGQPPPSPQDEPSASQISVPEQSSAVEYQAAQRDGHEAVAHPSRVLRLAAMAQALLVQIQHIELDDAARHRLAAVFNHTVQALRELLSDELQGEIDRLQLRLPDDPTDPELRVAQAQLVGWLEGLFHGIRTTVLASQLATQEELAGAYQQGLEAARQQPSQRGASPYL